MRSNSSRRGFTLVELLVVIAIIGILIGMLLPAVQQVREAARRATCMNNIRQLALACHNYESAHSHFPPGTNYWAQNDTQRFISPWNNQGGTAWRGNYHGWGYFILPFMEQNNLYDSFEFNVAWSQTYVDQNGDSLTGKVLAPFTCPSDVQDVTHNSTYFTTGQTEMNGKSCYVACTGRNTWAGNQTRNSRSNLWGIMRINSKTGFGQITDGTSSTILLGERTSANETGSAPLQQQGAIWIGRMHHNNTAVPVADGGNYAWGGRAGGINYAVNGHFRSRAVASSGHTGGANVALADGSAHFLSDNLSLNTLQILATMQDGQVVSSF